MVIAEYSSLVNDQNQILTNSATSTSGLKKGRKPTQQLDPEPLDPGFKALAVEQP